ncbi:MAG: FimB/Mfa2 family fimbrial subunit [Alistipes sp.]|nr:FimB/Mfa2 family fimbrial subunit [Alistipes sp.]
MKNKTEYKKIFLHRATILFAAALAMAGCIKEEALPGAGTGGTDHTLVQFSIRVPGSTVPATRSISDDTEKKVESVEILAFDGDDFLYHKPVNGSEIGNDGIFTVTLPLSDTEVRFMVLVNATDILQSAYGIGEITTTDDYDAIRKNLVLNSSAAWKADGDDPGDYDPLPMWGEQSFKVTVGMSGQSVTLVRMHARINVFSKVKEFELKEVWLYNPMEEGYLVPDPGWLDAGKTVVDNPSIGPLWQRSNGRNKYPVVKISDEEQKCANEIYTFEAFSGDGTDTDNTFLVIGGYYNGSTDLTYFRLDIANPKKTDPTLFEYIPLLRNHTYDFTINKVEGPGHPEIDDAIAAGPVNDANYELTVENEFALRDYVWDDKYFLGIEKKSIRVVSFIEYTINFKLNTDFPDGWTAEIDDACKSWLKFENNEHIISRPNSEKVLPIVISTPEVGKTGKIYVTAGRLSLTVEVNTEHEFVSEVFATSNVVQNGKGELWFATSVADNYIVPANAQGLNFKQGSLVGLNCDADDVELAFDSKHVKFHPAEYTPPTEWTWADIPYFENPVANVDDQFIERYPGIGYDASEATGDVCRYISDKGWVEGKWRIPNQEEFKLLRASPVHESTGDGVTVWPLQAISNIPGTWGTAKIERGWWMGKTSSTDMEIPPEGTLFLPACGGRNRNTGEFRNQGQQGFYWATTGVRNNYFYYMLINYGGSMVSDVNYIYGWSIRCIRDYQNDY